MRGLKTTSKILSRNRNILKVGLPFQLLVTTYLTFLISISREIYCFEFEKKSANENNVFIKTDKGITVISYYKDD